MVKFNNPILSIAGQKERLTNVINTFAAPFKGQAILVNDKKIPVVSQALSVLTGAAVVGSAAYGGAVLYNAAGATAASAANVASKGSSLKNLAIVGGAGALLGSILNSGNGASGKQETTGQQETNIPVTPQQKTEQNPPFNQNPTQYGGSPFEIYGSNNRVNYNYKQTQDTYANYTYNAMATPEQPISVSANPMQDLTPTQTTTSTGGTNWLLIAGIAVGAYMLAKN